MWTTVKIFTLLFILTKIWAQTEETINTDPFESENNTTETSFTQTVDGANVEILPGCGGYLNGSDNGTINSPGYPNNYPDNIDCVWTVLVSPGSNILITFADLAIESHVLCAYDYLEVRDGETDSAPLLNRLCASVTPAPAQTTGPYAYIKFHTDGSRSDRGFLITYAALTNCTKGFFGEECSQNCTCNAATTQSCDKVNGTCLCKKGWTSSDCSVDEDECLNLSSPCSNFSHCVNTPGSFVCKCDDGYHSVNSGCKACPLNKYGPECSKQCTCDTAHSSCNSVSGKCDCHTGWEGDNCDKDKDECSQTNNCTAANKEHWVCINTQGSYKCDCKNGYQQEKNISNCVDFDECAADFSNECDQGCTNIVGSYTCSCNKGYKLATDGYKCEDIDECNQNPGVCQQVCSNNVGGYDCSCQDGYQAREDNPTSCYTAVKANTEITIPVDVKNKNLKEQKGKDFLELKALIESALKEAISETVEGVTSVLVTQLRKGSLIIDFTTLVDKTKNPKATTKMVEAILLLLENGLTINQTHYNVTIKIGGFVVNSTIDKCLILDSIEPCMKDETCTRNTAGEAYCKTQDDDGSVDIPLTVGLAVGISLGVALILAIAAACCYKKFSAERK